MKALRHALARGDRGLDGADHRDEGFGLMECIVAMVVLLGVLIPTAYLFTNVLGQSAIARQRITALSLAEQIIENLNNSGPPTDTNNQPEVGTTLSGSTICSDMTSACSNGTATLSGIVYTATAIFNWTDASGGTPDFCTSGTSPVLGLQVKVTWGSGQSITDQAILNFPPSGDITNGYLAIQVSGETAGTPPNGVAGVPVEVSGSALSTPYSLTPSSDGCTFLQVPPGTYTVQVGPDGTYVANYNEASSETQALSNQSAITVIAAEVTQVSFQFDQGAYVDLSYPSTTSIDDGITCPNTTILTCLAMGQTYSSSTSPATGAVAVGIAKTSSGWSTATFPSTMTRIEDVACASSMCIAVGYSSSGGAAAYSTNGTTWTSTTLPAAASATQLTSITCPTGATTFNCVAIGSKSSGAVVLSAVTSGSSPAWTPDTLSSGTPTELSELTCPGVSSGTPVCFAMGTASGDGTIISNTGSTTTWHAFSPTGVTMSTLTSLVCNASTFCMAIGTSTTSSTPEIISITSTSGTTVTWKPYTTSTFTMSSFTTLACTTSGDFCWAGGTGKIGSGSVGPLIVYCNATSTSLCVSTSGGDSTWTDDTVPSSATSVSSLTCPSSTAPCFALDTTSSSAGVLSLASGSTSWSAPSLPNSSSIVSATQLDCSTTTNCYVVGTTSTAAFVDVLASGSWTAATYTNTTGGSPVYISGIACTASTTCYMSGATESAGEVFNYSSSGTTFSASGTPSGLTGMYLDNPPIMVSNSNLEPSSVVEMSSPTTANGPQIEVGPLFPFSNGYSVSLGYCSSEATSNSVLAATSPAGTSTVNAPLEMGILPIEATTSSGAVLSNATITIVDESCTSELTPQSSGSFPALSNPPANPSNPTSYSMPTSAVDGFSRIAVIYGTYLVTVTSGGTTHTTTVTVNPTSIVTGTTSPVTYYMPAFVPIPD